MRYTRGKARDIGRFVLPAQIGHAGVEGNRDGMENHIGRKRFDPFLYHGLDGIAVRAGIGKEFQYFDFIGCVGGLGLVERDVQAAGVGCMGKGGKQGARTYGDDC